MSGYASEMHKEAISTNPTNTSSTAGQSSVDFTPVGPGKRPRIDEPVTSSSCHEVDKRNTDPIVLDKCKQREQDSASIIQAKTPTHEGKPASLSNKVSLYLR